MATNKSEKFMKVKGLYDSGAWGEKYVNGAVVKGWITEAEYKSITGKTYKA